MLVPQYPYPVLGGLEWQAHELSRELVAQGVRVQVLSGKIITGQPDFAMVEGVPVYRIPWATRKWVRFLRTPCDVARILYGLRHDYDVIHLHQHSWFGLFCILLAKVLAKPIVTKLPTAGKFGVLSYRTIFLGKLKERILKCSDALIAMSPVSMTELDWIGFPESRILGTPNGINCINRPFQREETTVHAICRVVYVGRLSRVKNLHVLLEAWKQVALAARCQVTLELWGSGPLDTALQQQCNALGLHESVAFCGHVDGVREQLPKADIFVLPSMIEGNSNALLEAMAAGLPIVSTRVGGTPMLVGPEGADYLCDAGDADGLASRLLELIHDKALRERLGQAMRRRVERYFDMRHVAATYVSAYRFLATAQRERVYEASNPVVTGQ
ncbi:MAG: hypothetical protein BWK76_17355 [Desulfobulbaceae bacterium A2]|nr:MAG: hypothetical protein BWK76_17355 [Desulfobulbaceae bacterium A2]